MKTIGLTTCGGFKAWWLAHGVASVYNLIDEMIVAIGGPGVNQEYLKPMLKEVDPNGKVRFIYPTWQEAPDYINPGRDDVRSLNKTVAVQEAHKRGADWIIAFDCDMVYYETLGPVVRELINKDGNSYRFTMITLSPDLYHTDFLMPWDSNMAMADSQYSYLTLFRSYANLYYGGCAHIGTDRAGAHFPQTTDRRVTLAHLWAVTPNPYDRAAYIFEKFYWSQYVHQQTRLPNGKTGLNLDHVLSHQELCDMAMDRLRARLDADAQSPPNGRIPLGSLEDCRVPKAPPLVLQDPYLTSPLKYIEANLP